MKFWFVSVTIGRFIGLAGLWLFVTTAYAQPYHTLTVDDFQGVPRTNNGEVVAYTNCSIDFRYEAHHERDYYVLNFNIELTVNTDKSWIDRRRITSPEMLAEILKHEQGHYIIAYMEQQELLREVSRTVFRADYQYAAANIFNRVDAKYKQLNLDYDEDTQHMVNRQQQQSWDAYFKKRLDYMPPVSP
jgi:hypothetical protein